MPAAGILLLVGCNLPSVRKESHTYIRSSDAAFWLHDDTKLQQGERELVPVADLDHGLPPIDA